MIYTPEVRKDLVHIFLLTAFIGLVLGGIKMYDAKTNKVGVFGNILFEKYVD